MNAAGRAETLRYHSELYASDDYPPWLSRPAQYILDASALLSSRPSLRALDLGAGVGRHSIPMAARPNHHVHAIDLVEAGLQRLAERAAAAQIQGSISVESADVETFDFGQDAWDLIVSCSCIEHVSGLPAFQDVLRRVADATRQDGIVVFMIATDVVEHTPSGQRPSLREFSLSESDARQAVRSAFGTGWQILDESTKSWDADETRGQESYRICCTCVQFTAQRLSPSHYQRRRDQPHQ